MTSGPIPLLLVRCHVCHCLCLYRGKAMILYLCRYVEDSVAYTTGLASMAEAVPTARQQRDATLKRILLDGLQVQLAAAAAHTDALRRVVQVIANVACLTAAAPALDDFTVLRARCNITPCACLTITAQAREDTIKSLRRGMPANSQTDIDAGAGTWQRPARLDGSGSASASSAGPAGAAVLLAALQTVQEAGDRCVVSIVASEAGSAVGRAKVQEWLPEAPPRSTAALSAWTEQLLAGFKVCPSGLTFFASCTRSASVALTARSVVTQISCAACAGGLHHRA